MDKTDKIKAQIKGPMKPRDHLFQSAPQPIATTKGPSIPKGERSKKIVRRELMTLPLTKDEKILIEDLGRKLQRQRSIGKRPELNWKTILQGFIGLLDENSFDGVSVSTEEELYDWMKKKFRKG